MFLEKAVPKSRVFNLDDETDIAAYDAIKANPAVRILDKKMINHTETSQFGRDKTETKEVHLFVEWVECSL